MLQSKAAAASALVIIILLTIFTVATGVVREIWEYSALFCAFMSAFCHLMALNLKKMSQDASKKLDFGAMIFGILTVVAIVIIFILSQID